MAAECTILIVLSVVYKSLNAPIIQAGSQYHAELISATCHVMLSCCCVILQHDMTQ